MDQNQIPKDPRDPKVLWMLEKQGVPTSDQPTGRKIVHNVTGHETMASVTTTLNVPEDKPVKIWANMVDSKYDVYVVRKEPYKGILTVELKGTKILEETVTLAYDAKMGPDIDDVNLWCKKAVEIVDAHEANNKESK